MNATDLLSSYAETIKLIISEIKEGDKETNRKLIIQTISFFNEILNLLSKNSSLVMKNIDVINATSLFLSVASVNINCILLDFNDTKTFVDFFKIFLRSQLAQVCNESITNFIVNLLKTQEFNKNALNLFESILDDYFNNSFYRENFMIASGFEAAWCSYLMGSSNFLITYLFQKFLDNITFYSDYKFRIHTENFIRTISSSISELPKDKCKKIFQILLIIVEKDPKSFYPIYDQFGLFKSLKTIIINQPDTPDQDENDSFLHFMFKFSHFVPYEKNGKLNQPLSFILNIIEDQKCSNHIREKCINFLIDIIKSQQNPFQPNRLSQIALSIPETDPSSFLQFIKLCQLLQTEFQFDMMLVLPAIVHFCTYNFAIEMNIQSLLSFFIGLGNSFLPHISVFFTRLFNNVDPSQFAKLFNKYDEIFTLFELFFGDNLNEEEKIFLLKQYIKSLPYIENEKMGKMVFSDIVLSKKGFKYINSILHGIEEMMVSMDSASSIVDLLIRCALVNKSFSSECIYQKSISILVSFYSNYKFASSHILNFISAITMHQYISEFDQYVFQTLKDINFLDESPENLLDLALGLQIGEDKTNGSLCFPSLLYRCSNHNFTYPFDLWLCGNISIKNWIQYSNKPISEFPSIVSIARQFILPQYCKLILQDIKLTEEIFKGGFLSTPLFEFAPLKNDISFEIVLFDFLKSVSFWFYFKSFTLVLTNIFTLGSVSLSIKEDSFIINGEKISTVTPNKWYFLTFTFDGNNKYSLFLDCEKIYEYSSKFASTLVFGSKYSVAHWYIGGAIRIFKESLLQNQIQQIFKYGVSYIEPTEIAESMIYTPYNAAPLFQTISSEKLQNSRPITIYSLLDFFKSYYQNATPFFMKIIDFFYENKIEEAKSLANTICSMQKLNITSWKNTEFASYMSIICGYNQDIVSPRLIDEICECFISEKEEKFDWDAFFIFSLDYHFFMSEIGSYLFSYFFQYSVRFPFTKKSKLNIVFTDFLLSLLFLSDIREEFKQTIFDLLKIHCKSPSQIIRAIVSFPDFEKDLQDYSSKYIFTMSPIIENLLDISLLLPMSSFNEYYALRFFNPKQSFQILEKLMAENFTGINEKEIIRYCYDNIQFIQAWEITISIFLNKPLRLDDLDFDYSTFRMEYYETCIKFVTSLVYVAARTSSSNFWNQLCCKLLKTMTDLANKQKEYNSKIVKYLLMMMTFGMPYKHKCAFPPGPSLTEPNEIIEYSMIRGQLFPDEQPEPYSLPDFPFKISKSDIVDLSNYVPHEITLTSKSSVPMDLKLKGLSYIIIEKQTETADFNWETYINNLYQHFGIDNPEEFDVENSNVSIHVSKFIIAEIQMFNKLIKILLSTHLYFPYKLSVYWMQHLSIEMLQICDSSNLYIHSFISFVCQRLIEGWFPSLFLVILSNVFSILKKVSSALYPKSFYHCVLFSMDLVHSNQVSMVGDLINENRSVILQPQFYEDLTYTLIFIYRSISLFPFLTESFAHFWLDFIECIEKSELLHQKWKKNYQIDLDKVLIGLKILGNQGFLAFTEHKNNDDKFWETFDSFLQNIYQESLEKFKLHFISKLEKLIHIKKHEGKEFLKKVQHILMSNSSHLTRSKAIASSQRYFSRRSFAFKCSYFIRFREMIISYNVPFINSKSTHYSMSLLSDPILPTRRVTKSPFEYTSPTYPAGLSDSIFSYTPNLVYDHGVFPKCIVSCFCTCKIRIPSLLRRSPHGIHARYTQSAQLPPLNEYQLFLEIVNHGKKFEYASEVSFLYGVDVLEGTAFFDSKRLIFLEGMKLRDGEMLFHVHPAETNPISQEFYMQCFQSNIFSRSIFTYCGHFCIITNINQIIAATNHLWIQKPYSITLNYSLGYSFVLNFAKQTYDEAYQRITQGISNFFQSAPPETGYLSPIGNARLLLEKQKKLTNMWVEGYIDNFTYLCILNRLGKRCFSDLTQYPVFPWVIADYYSPQLFKNMPIESYRDLSKPMGQLGEERARKFDAIYEDSYPQYYYGTHYLHYGVVVYFMFRIDPFSIFSFILHRGWDNPQRIFSKVSETWLSASAKSQSDVKELVPQMYKVHDYLTNGANLPLIVESKNIDVRTVTLPKWANNPRNFIEQNCKFFESDYTSSNLNKWIDLIFGVNSRGPGAAATKNIFHPNCYPEYSKSMEETDDPIEKQAFVSSIINFGQISPQVFMKPHPKKNIKNVFSHLMSQIDRIVFQKLNPGVVEFPISDFTIRVSDIIFSISELAGTMFSVVLPSGQIYSANDPAISNIDLSKDGFLVVKIFLDGHIDITMLKYKRGLFSHETKIGHFSTDFNLRVCAISSEHFLVLAAHDKTILQFDIGTMKTLDSIDLQFEVQHIAIDDEAAVFWVTGGTHICLFSISGELLIEDSLPSVISSIFPSPLHEYIENRFAVAGHCDGTVSFLGFSYSDMKINLLQQIRISDEPILHVKIDS